MSDDLDAVRRSGSVNGQVDEFMTTGAVVAGRGTVSRPAGGRTTTTASRSSSSPATTPAELPQWPFVTYVSDVTEAMAQAKEAAGDKDVLVHGAGVTQLALAAGVLDELELNVVPVLFGQGRHLFEGMAAEQIELERTRVLAGEDGVTRTCTTASKR